LEQWLIDVANQRGARSVRRPAPPSNFTAPGDAVLSGAELIVALCQLQCLDQPHILRVAAQLISRGAFDATQLRRIAVMERVEPILQGLSRLALHVDPASQYWRTVGGMFAPTGSLREPLLHWSRLAQPVMQNGHCNAASWELLA
jgi:hypothetical protein